VASREESEQAETVRSAARSKGRAFSRPQNAREHHPDELPVIDAEQLMVIGVLAEGGIGRVVHGYDTRYRRHVAIKQVRDATTPRAEARLLREARLPARIAHPGIVEIFGVGRWPDGDAFYVMRMIHGQSLGQVLESHPDAAERQRLVLQVLAVTDAIGHAHAQRIIHRDLKPDNILVSNRGQAIVIDWGLAKDLAAEHDDGESGVYRADDPRLTCDGQIVGTPAYMPPEQARGDRVDARADVYALGAVLLHVLSGAPPYTAPTSREVIEQVLAGPPAALAGLRWPPAPRLCEVVARAMDRDPERRFADARDLAAAIRIALDLSLP